MTVTAGSLILGATITLCLALGLIQAMRRSRAATRHAVLAAAFGVLLVSPFAATLARPVHIVVQLAIELAPAAAPLELMTDGTIVSQPADHAARSVPPQRAWTLPSPLVFLACVWLLGTILFLVPVAAGLWETRRLQRSATAASAAQDVVDALRAETGMRRRVDVRLQAAVPGPMTCGVRRPVILLPADVAQWSREDLLRALVHELEHARRLDWLVHSLARAIAAVYWFHPLAWMAWRRLVLDAERACDDAVLRRSDPAAYAEQLVALAQRIVDGRRALPAMADRRDLPSRVAALLNHRQHRGPAGIAWVAGIVAVALGLVLSMSPLRIELAAQSSVDARRFEVASVKVCGEEPPFTGQRRPEFTATPGHVYIDCLPLQRIVFHAYAGVGALTAPLLNIHQSDPARLRGGPAWIFSDKFTIEATAAEGANREVMMGVMLRALLEDRFQLRIRREREPAPMYALRVARGGLKLKPMAPDGCTSFETASALSQEQRLALSRGASPICGSYTALGDGVNRTWILGGDTLARFAANQLSSVLDRFVVDETGIGGQFNIRLEFGLDESIRAGVFGGRPLTPPDSTIARGPSIFTALEEQLGLTIARIDGEREFLIIDRVERPAPD